MVGRLPRPAGRTRIGKPELLKIERLNISLDRSHRVVPPHIVFNPRRQKARLFPAVAGLETVIRHKTNRTPSRQSRYEYLPSLYAQPTLRRLKQIPHPPGVRRLRRSGETPFRTSSPSPARASGS